MYLSYGSQQLTAFPSGSLILQLPSMYFSPPIQMSHCSWRSSNRWWIAGVVWDEESGAGPIPVEYLPEAEE